MLDIKFIRENKDLFAAGAIKKHIDFNIEELIVADDERRALLSSVEAGRKEQNDFAEKIPRENDAAARTNLVEQSKKAKIELKEKDFNILNCYFDSISDEEQPKVAKQLEKLGL